MAVEMLTSPLLRPMRHGFFTRAGGASSGIFKGLNCGPGSSDQSGIVALNRRIAADALGVGEEALISVSQVHSADVLVIGEADTAPEGSTTARARADAMVTSVPGRALAVLTADCQPVLFADAEARVIGAAHAGWKGLLGGVLEATIHAMEELGAMRGRIRAVIGPTISQAAYEVGPEFLETFLAADAGNARFFAQGTGDRLLFDLPGYGLARLRAAGVGQAEWTRHCTFSDPALFYSYRRATREGAADYGRLISAIRL